MTISSPYGPTRSLDISIWSIEIAAKWEMFSIYTFWQEKKMKKREVDGQGLGKWGSWNIHKVQKVNFVSLHRISTFTSWIDSSQNVSHHISFPRNPGYYCPIFFNPEKCKKLIFQRKNINNCLYSLIQVKLVFYEESQKFHGRDPSTPTHTQKKTLRDKS